MRTLFAILGCLLAAAAAVFAAPPPPKMEWKAGFATIKNTPETPIPMAGYDSRKKPFERVEQDLFAKALALEDGEGHRAVLVTTDLLGLSRAIAEPACKRIGEQVKLERSQILLNSAHTHSGPLLDDGNLAESGIAVEDAQHIAAYTKELQDKLVEVAVRAFDHLEPAELSWGSGVAHFAMNRREFTPRGIILGANPRGLVDRTVPMLRVDLAGGKLRAVVFGYACHNTTLTPSNMSLCGDYAGFAQSYIEEHEPGAQAMFMIGCGGDANPYPRGTMEDARANGATLGQEVCRVLDDAVHPLTPIYGPLACGIQEASLPLQKVTREELEGMVAGPSYLAGNAKGLLASLGKGEKLADHYDASVALWQFGRDLTLVGLSGEVVAGYVPLIEQTIGPGHLWIAAYCNDVFGYLPTDSILREGGYETRGLYTTNGFFAQGAQAALLDTIHSLAQVTGRRLLEEGAPVDLGAGRGVVTKFDNLPFVDDQYSKRFQFDSATNPKLAELRKRYHLDEVVASGKDEFSKQLLLNDWAHQQFGKFGHPSVDTKGALDILKGVEDGQTFFCAQYATLLVSASASLGWADRSLALRRHEGVAKVGGSTEHSVTEIWSNQYRKWVMLDPTLDMYLEKDRVPLDAYEIRQEWFYHDGKDLVFVVGKDRQKYKKSDLPISQPHIDGHPDLPIYPDELDKYGFIGYVPNTNLMDASDDYGKMFIVKDKLCDATHWHERVLPAHPAVDPYFPIDQASLALRSENGAISVSVRTFTPNFDRYEARIDGAEWKTTEDRFSWNVHPGMNRLQVRTVNQFGVTGPVSSAELSQAGK